MSKAEVLNVIKQAQGVHKTGAKNALKILEGLGKAKNLNYDMIARVTGHLQNRLRDLAAAENCWLAVYEGRGCSVAFEQVQEAAFPCAGQREAAWEQARALQPA